MIEPTQNERDMIDRFAKMEQKWREANARQKATIDRLMGNRQKVLDVLNDFESQNHASDLLIAHHGRIREALG